jgi:hypothetical protein
LPDQPAGKKDVDLLSVFNKHRIEVNKRFAKQDAILASHEKLLTNFASTMQAQQASNDARDNLISQMKSDISEIKASQRGDSMILQKMSRLWLAEDQSGPKPKSHAIGTWPGWKIAATFFTVLGGLVLAYQILVPVLIALNNVLLNIRVH